MNLKVCKFGGTSMADGNVINKVASIINEDKSRKFVVVSAPGKRYSNDIKVTDLLYKCYREAKDLGTCASSFSVIRDRFIGIVNELKLNLDIISLLDKTQKEIDENLSSDFSASRGEYLSANVIACRLGAKFIDAKDIIKFNSNGEIDEITYKLIAEATKDAPLAVIPGFYGEDFDGKIKTFSRGGSDITGAVIARGVNASLYENWTDVSGFLACDPRIVDNPKNISKLTYKELRELSYMGASVLHSESIFPVRKANIPIQIKNTFKPEDTGTLILPSVISEKNANVVTGIAGKKNFTVIFLEKSLMNSEIGFAYKVLSILYKHKVSFEHMPSGIDTLSLVIESNLLVNGVLEEIISDINEMVSPDDVRVLENIALVATVGHGMSKSVGTSAKLFKALSDAKINVKMIDQGSSELNIIVGVDNDDMNDCIKAIYDKFFID